MRIIIIAAKAVNPTAQPLVVPLLLEVIESVLSFVPVWLSLAASRPLG
jgi:hypothetical protein